ncbi:NAD(P)H-quinone oxidoreductase [Deinococcus sp.]|uniref:NAD(P)H-quinone oxidoreductase n=1 Tax=Deinococcus sp. TaxID=47478 RepID=UPI003CC50494
MQTEVPETMRAVVVRGGKGPASALELEQVPVPVPREGQVLIRVRAAGVNRPDLFQRMGAYPPPPGASDRLGLEVAGEIALAATLGTGSRWQVGEKVCALVPGGGYSEYVVCDARHALPVPTGLDFEAAAGLPETMFTVYANVFAMGGLRAGQTFMVHGATSGIGVTAIQMARAAGARVIATGRGADKAQTARALGAEIAVDVTREDFVRVASEAGGVDVVLDMVGGDYATRNLEALKLGGRVVYIAALAGGELRVPISAIMQKRAVITGSTLRPRSDDEKAHLAAELERVAWPWIASGQVKPLVDRVFPLAGAAAAHTYLEGGTHVGKVILSVP